MTSQMDPQILLHPECEHSTVGSEDDYVDRIVEWFGSDREFTVGHFGREFLVEEFARFGYPENRLEFTLPIDFSLVIKQISRLINRSYNEDFLPASAISDPTPSGDDVVRNMLEGELSLAASGGGRVFATALSHWLGEPEVILLADGREVEGIMSPQSVSHSESVEVVARYFETRVLIIVGGVEDKGFLARLNDMGVRAKETRWLEVEKDLSPKVLRRQLKGIRQGDYVVACWTGRIGHDGSGIVNKECVSRGVGLVRGESLTDLANELRAVPGSLG